MRGWSGKLDSLSPATPRADRRGAEDTRAGPPQATPTRGAAFTRRSPADRFRNRMDLDLVFAARRIPHLVAPPVVRDDVIQDGPGTVLRGDVGPIQVAPLRSHRNRVEVVQADALQPQGDVRDPARIRDLGRNRDRLADVPVARQDLPDSRRGGVEA